MAPRKRKTTSSDLKETETENIPTKKAKTDENSKTTTKPINKRSAKTISSEEEKHNETTNNKTDTKSVKKSSKVASTKKVKHDEVTDTKTTKKLVGKKTAKVTSPKKETSDEDESHKTKSSKNKLKKKTINVSKKAKIKKEQTDDEEISKDVDDGKPKITRQMIQGSQKWVGAHVSISGGLYKAVEEACSLESNAFGLFLRSQRRWDSPPLTQKSIDEFKKTIHDKQFGCSISTGKDKSYFETIKHQILPHGSYLINLGNPDKAKREKSYSVFIDDLKRCDDLSIALYNLHPGSTCGETTIEKSIEFIAEGINRAHKETKNVKIVIENMAGQGNVVGKTFKELADIIKLTKNKDRIGICLDTCHLFAAGYDVRTPESWNKILNEFDQIVGMKYLMAMHLNDSKGPLGCNKDRHESIGKGYIGLDCFKFIMQDSRFCNMPLILETPDVELYFKEIQLLHSFISEMNSFKKNEIKKEIKN